MWARQLAALPTACCSMARLRCWLSIQAMGRSRTGCGWIRGDAAERCNARLLRAGELVGQFSVVSSQLSEKADALSVVRSTLPVKTQKQIPPLRCGMTNKKALRNDKQGAVRNDKQGTVISFLAMDVSFISATLVLPAVLRALAPEGERWRGEAVVLIKPQFEAGREYVGKGGICARRGGAGDCDRAGEGVRGGAGWGRIRRCGR